MDAALIGASVRTWEGWEHEDRAPPAFLWPLLDFLRQSGGVSVQACPMQAPPMDEARLVLLRRFEALLKRATDDRLPRLAAKLNAMDAIIPPPGPKT